jgi:protein-disulfide isomerase
VIEFSDFECPYCAAANQGLQDLLAKYPSQIRFVYRHFPLTGIHSNAFRAAEASECAGEQKSFWEMHDILFSNQNALNEKDLFQYASVIGLDMDYFNTCMTSGKVKTAIEQDIADGQKYGVNGTPTFFLNNKMFMSLSDLEAAVQEALTKP